MSAALPATSTAPVPRPRIAVFHTEDAYGRDGLDAVTRAMAEAGLPVPASAAYDVRSPDVPAAVIRLAGAEAVVMFASAAPLAEFVAAMRGRGTGAVLVAGSAADMVALVKSVGLPQARGIGYLRSIPAPSDRSRVGREFRALWARSGRGTEPTPFHLEGCLAAQVALRAAAAAGPRVTGAQLSRRLKAQGPQAFGDFRVDFSNRFNEGSSWVGIAVVDERGRLRD